MIIWTALASVLPRCWATAGFPTRRRGPAISSRRSPRLIRPAHFPHRSLLLIVRSGTLACLADLGTVIAALLTSRILIQFVGQIVTVFYLRKKAKGPASTYRMPLYPVPALVSIGGLALCLFHVGTARAGLWTAVVARRCGGLLVLGQGSPPHESVAVERSRFACFRGVLRVISNLSFRSGWEGATPAEPFFPARPAPRPPSVCRRGNDVTG